MEDLLSRFAPCPEPPYYVAILTSSFSGESEILERATTEVLRLAARHPGFLGAEMARGEDGFGILLSYWTDRASLDEWNDDVFEQIREEFGQPQRFTIFDRRIMRIARVEAFEEMEPEPPGKPG